MNNDFALDCIGMCLEFWNSPEAAFNSLMGFNGWGAGCQNNQEKDGQEDSLGMQLEDIMVSI